MTQFLFANNASSTLGAALGAGATTVSLVTGGGSVFPNPGAGQQFALTLSAFPLFEIVYVTAVNGDTLTVVRGQEGSTDQAWAAGTLAQLLVTAGTLQSLLQATAEGGWALPTGTLSRATFNPASVTLAVLAETVAALVTDLYGGGVIT